MSEPQNAPSAPPQYSPDGRWWWDGYRWLEVHPAMPGRRHAPLLVVTLTLVGLVLVAVVGWVAASMVDAAHTKPMDEDLDRQICQTFPEDC